MDVGLISFVMAALAAQWKLSPTETSWLASIGFVGMALGATFGGLLADKFGRRHIFSLTLLIYSVATGASALAGSLAVLIALRFVVGLGLGAELPVASTLISEFAPRRVRGRMVVLLEAFWALGWILAAVIGTFVVSASDSGWRWALAIGCVPALYSFVVRLTMPESVRFLESRGQHAKAEEVVRSFEASRPLASEKIQAIEGDVISDANLTHSRHLGFFARETDGGVMDRVVLHQFQLLWRVYLDSVAAARAGLHAGEILQLYADHHVGAAAGLCRERVVIERWGRRPTLALFLVGSAVSAAGFGLAAAPWQIILAGCLLSFFNLGAWGALYAIGPELYPTHLRGTGTGAAAGFGRIASIIAPLVVPPLLAFGGQGMLFAVFGAAFAVAAVAAFTLPEQRGKVLSD